MNIKSMLWRFLGVDLFNYLLIIKKENNKLMTVIVLCMYNWVSGMFMCIMENVLSIMINYYIF